MDGSRSLRELLEEHDAAVKREMADFESRIDEEVEKMRAEFGPPHGKYVGKGFTRCMALIEIQFRALREDLRLVRECRAKERKPPTG